MHTILLRLTSWHYKYNLRRSIVYKDGKTLFKRKAHRTVPPNASFTDGVATKDCSLDLTNRVSIRIFLPDHCLGTQITSNISKPFSWLPERSEHFDGSSVLSSYDASPEYQKFEENEVKKAYYPNMKKKNKKLPVILQFHDGAFVNGSKDMEANDIFCRRIAKMCRSVVIAVGYRLAPEHKFPSSRDDGIETLRWLARQANLAEFSSSDAISASVGLVDSFSYMLADPWVTAHVDYSRCGCRW
ncbi:hypothetical protein O6H91_13G053200 [Diphasiastrum complanatum]|uniref:Uncharacterized protein n=1 Tax=Diphasiastrum complanatum TaxID=34168 RepID=A0ACC2BUQ4_DIPCM|nr:hypothetical protein O6H91_Y519400 [Diphasiastrum complanatum]KAJ7533518.1 hypothetical protein O6H91_13G053200 [Diphasiastrum complanatum]